MTPHNSIGNLLSWAAKELAESESGLLDARLLMSHCLSQPVVYLLTWPEKELSDVSVVQFKYLIEQRKVGRPVAHLLGYRDFWTLTLEVTDQTLIPRPETELLVELALALSLPNNANVLDLGTGTGAIALALSSERTRWQILGVDRMAAAVELANKNALKNSLQRVNFIQSHWFEHIPTQQFDLIVSNPPYVESASPYLLNGDVRFEPKSALTAGPDGMDDIDIIIAQSTGFLTPSGWLMLEHGHTQAEEIHQRLNSAGFINITTRQDLNGLDRVTQAQLHKS